MGTAVPKLFGHAVWRAFLLIALGIFLRSTRGPQTNFTFEDTLTQIGLGYPFLFLLGFRSARWQWGALGAILTGYWLAWALYPLPATYDYQAAGVPADWPHHYNGLAAHWNKNNTLGLAFDEWFMNLFPRVQPFCIMEKSELPNGLSRWMRRALLASMCVGTWRASGLSGAVST